MYLLQKCQKYKTKCIKSIATPQQPKSLGQVSNDSDNHEPNYRGFQKAVTLDDNWQGT